MPIDSPLTRLEPGAVPKHAQVKAALAQHCRTTLRPGDALDSERDLMALFGVSRTTIRRAVGDLVAEGVLVRTPGKGTFVARRRVETHLHLASFTDDMRRRGLEPSSQTLLLELTRAPAAVTTFFGTHPGMSHWHLARLRLADGEPMAYEDCWYNVELVPDLDRHEPLGSLYELLGRHYGLVVDGAEQVVWAEVAGAELAARLELTEPGVVLTFDRRSHSARRPLEYAVSHYRADRYQVHMTLERSLPDLAHSAREAPSTDARATPSHRPHPHPGSTPGVIATERNPS